MYRDLKIGAVLTVSIAALACNRSNDVQQQERDLREAQARSPQVAKDLEADLAKAKDHVAQLEQKLALARQGITDEVLSKRKDLQEALEAQEKHVNTEIGEAQRAAEQHNQDTTKATQALEATKPPAQVSAQVKTQTKVVPAQPAPAQATEHQEIIPVRGQAPATTGEVDAGVERAAPSAP